MLCNKAALRYIGSLLTSWMDVPAQYIQVLDRRGSSQLE